MAGLAHSPLRSNPVAAISGFAIESAQGLAGAQAIADLTGRIWDEDVGVSDYPALARHIQLFPAGHLVAGYGQNPVGSAAGFPAAAVPTFAELNRGVYRLYMPCGPLYYLHLIQGLPEHRGRGLGQRLLERQLDIARAAGCTEVIGEA